MLPAGDKPARPALIRGEVINPVLHRENRGGNGISAMLCWENVDPTEPISPA